MLMHCRCKSTLTREREDSDLGALVVSLILVLPYQTNKPEKSFPKKSLSDFAISDRPSKRVKSHQDFFSSSLFNMVRLCRRPLALTPISLVKHHSTLLRRKGRERGGKREDGWTDGRVYLNFMLCLANPVYKKVYEKKLGFSFFGLFPSA